MRLECFAVTGTYLFDTLSMTTMICELAAIFALFGETTNDVKQVLVSKIL